MYSSIVKSIEERLEREVAKKQSDRWPDLETMMSSYKDKLVKQKPRCVPCTSCYSKTLPLVRGSMHILVHACLNCPGPLTKSCSSAAPTLHARVPCLSCWGIWPVLRFMCYYLPDYALQTMYADMTSCGQCLLLT